MSFQKLLINKFLGFFFIVCFTIYHRDFGHLGIQQAIETITIILYFKSYDNSLINSFQNDLDF